MHTTIRIYKSHDLGDALVQRRDEVEKIVSHVAGFHSYQLIRTDNGVASITTCENQDGCEESSRLAAQFVREQLPNIQATPEILQGDVAISFGGSLAAV